MSRKFVNTTAFRHFFYLALKVQVIVIVETTSPDSCTPTEVITIVCGSFVEMARSTVSKTLEPSSQVNTVLEVAFLVNFILISLTNIETFPFPAIANVAKQPVENSAAAA